MNAKNAAPAVFALACVLLPISKAADESDKILIHPEHIDKCLKSSEASSVEVNTNLNPYYLRGDFDGDGKADYAIAVRGRKTARNGVLVCVGNGRVFLLGADQPLKPPFSDMPDDNFFAPNWALRGRRHAR